MKNNQSVQKKSLKGNNSISSVQVLLSNEYRVKPSEDCIKKANNLIKISPLEHYNSYKKLVPYLEEFQRLNPGFRFSLEHHQKDFSFERVAILFPYSKHAINYCYNVVGVDAAFLDAIKVYKNSELNRFITGLPFDLNLIFKRAYLTAMSGRTLNNQMIIFALSITYSESIENYNFLFKFLKDNEVSIHFL